jgi:hypothetical protein
MREPEKILSHPVTRDTLDFTKPVALMLVAVLHFFTDDDQVRQTVGPLVDALPAGSYVAASHATSEFAPATVEEGGPTPAAVWTSSAASTTEPVIRSPWTSADGGDRRASRIQRRSRPAPAIPSAPRCVRIHRRPNRDPRRDHRACRAQRRDDPPVRRRR